MSMFYFVEPNIPVIVGGVVGGVVGALLLIVITVAMACLVRYGKQKG